jgi:formylglycine-generating enzyme required for sulfatase activity
MKIYQYFSGICLAWLCCLHGAVAQVSSGTGFAVVSGLLLTNNHVIESCSSVEVITENGRHKSVVVDADPQSDLALLRVPTLVGLSAKIRNPAVVNLGEPVMVFGFPLAGALTSSGNFTSGLVSGLRGLGESEGMFQITAPVQLGNSGGPVFDASGLVIGVITSKLNAVKTAIVTGDIPQNINFAITPEKLNDFLIKNRVSVEYSSSKKSLNTVSIAMLAQSFTYQIECMGKSEQAIETPKAMPRASALRAGETFKDCDECPEMVVIPAGRFLMGSPPIAELFEVNETPVHLVSINLFAIGKYEVTQEQWINVMGNNPSTNIGKKLPVENISWNDTQLFLKKLSKRTGKKYRLPTEAEWEYATNASLFTDVRTTYPWGNSDTMMNEYTWNNTNSNNSKPVGLKKPNQFGLYDTLGNVWEWTQDCWNQNYTGAPSDGSAWTSGDCSRRVLRGGAWHNKPRILRPSIRGADTPAYRSKYGGFRLALDVSLDISATPPTNAKPDEPVTLKEPAKTSPPEIKNDLRATPLKPGAVFKDCVVCPDMVVIPAGQFVMGASPLEAANEKLPKETHERSQPQHRVEIRQFAVGKFTVTRSQYEMFVNDTGQKSNGCYVWTGSKWAKDLALDWQNPGYDQDEKHPVTCVNWDDANAYVNWLSQKTGKKYRLLSEAEWEYAARAKKTSSRYWGDDGNLSCSYANGLDIGSKYQFKPDLLSGIAYCLDNYTYTSPVGAFQPNLFGLYDMLGNVWQWTQDCWNQNYTGAPSDGSAWTSGDCSSRVVRGGSWSDTRQYLRSAFRDTNPIAGRFNVNGFRVAKDLP